MNNKEKVFSAKKKSSNPAVYIIVYSIWMAIAAFSFFENLKTHSFISLIAMILIFSFLIIIIPFEIYAHYIKKKKNIPDITINNEQIIIPYSIFKSPKVIYINHIIDIHIPKWDDILELTIKDNSKIKINLNGFLEEDKRDIKDIFKNLEEKLKGVEYKPNKIKESYHLINGKQYIKKEKKY
ncbi:MAG: hypothetical protein K0R54_896 [Clostridiaceae bacterium]|jgi:hypothetical protein|nr:hypothetical protein [Clostridiaceae bacterium]